MTTNQNNSTSIIQLQLGIFFSKPLDRPDLLTRTISDKYTGIFDSAPINFPIPPGIVDFPSAQLNSSNNKFNIKISRIRADIYFTPEVNKKFSDIKSEKEKIEEMISKLFDEVKKQNVEVSRITQITNFFKLTKSPEEIIQKQFFKSINKNVLEPVVRFNVPVTERGIACNNIIQYEAGQVLNINDKNEDKGIMIMKDFNSDPNIKNNFNKSEIKTFFEIADKYSEEPKFE